MLVAKYQILILDPSKRFKEGLKNALNKRFGDLGIEPATAVQYLDESNYTSVDNKSPLAGVYFGYSPATEPHIKSVELLNRKAAIIIPVVDKLQGYTTNPNIPAVLHSVNALEMPDTRMEFEVIASAILEAFLLLRKTRRLFISYKREESRAVALQLYEELDQHGFDVFLDTHSVQVGEPFQEVLWHRLSDTDIMILLDTPNFHTGKWTMEEKAKALAMKIGILQLLWPKQQPTPDTALCFPKYLKESDFKDVFDPNSGENILKESFVKTIVDLIESLRARALAARHENLVHEFCLAANKAKAETIVQPDRHIALRKTSGEELIVVPTVGVPNAPRYQEVARLGDTNIFLVYDQTGIRDEWHQHLSWLDTHLPVKSVKIIDAEKWIKGA